MGETVLILGASGKAGHHAARAFEAAGWTVRRYDRRAGDMVSAARGCAVIVNALNPPAYHAWERLIPEITAQVIAAARAADALVILPGNVYNFAPRPGLWPRDTVEAPVSRKGRVRVAMERALRDSGVQTVVLRAGNFIDPERSDDVMGLVLLRSIRRGRITWPGRDPGVVQPYAFLPDWARAAAALAGMRSSLARFSDIPFPGHAFSAEDLRRELERALHRRLTITGFPWGVMRLAAPFWELAREVLEMRYLWDVPHRLDGTRLDALLPGFRATPLSQVMLSGLPADLHPDRPVAQAKARAG